MLTIISTLWVIAGVLVFAFGGEPSVGYCCLGMGVVVSVLSVVVVSSHCRRIERESAVDDRGRPF